MSNKPFVAPWTRAIHDQHFAEHRSNIARAGSTPKHGLGVVPVHPHMGHVGEDGAYNPGITKTDLARRSDASSPNPSDPENAPKSYPIPKAVSGHRSRVTEVSSAPPGVHARKGYDHELAHELGKRIIDQALRSK
jgi:hypothetical protein